ncbi:MAG TPA: preprotein translocase subunit SecE [Firmicutes bacterium]|nr:preprotein translocase subunit SecE [Bacillota bacterium]
MAPATANTPARDNRLAKYFREVRAEMRKVQWPNRKELIAYTNVTLLTVAVVAVFIFLIDLVFSGVLNLITGLGR